MIQSSSGAEDYEAWAPYCGTKKKLFREGEKGVLNRPREKRRAEVRKRVALIRGRVDAKMRLAK